jgi:hypothetical protein
MIASGKRTNLNKLSIRVQIQVDRDESIMFEYHEQNVCIGYRRRGIT